MNKYFKWFSYLNSVLWIILGLAIIGSSMLGPEYFLIHLIIGSIFCVIGGYFYLKTKTTLEVINQDSYIQTEKNNIQLFSSLRRFILLENILIVGLTLIAVLLLSGVISRIFLEGKAVFG